MAENSDDPASIPALEAPATQNAFDQLRHLAPVLNAMTGPQWRDLSALARKLGHAVAGPQSEDSRWHRYPEELTPVGQRRTDIVWRRAGSRLTSKYGSGVIGQLYALADFRINLALKSPDQIASDDPDAGDLTERNPFADPRGCNTAPYAPKSLERARSLTKELLADLEQAYAVDQNPVDAWEAFILALSVGVTPPSWVLAYLVDGGLEIIALRDQRSAMTHEDQPIKRKPTTKPTNKTAAELAGLCLGFGLKRKGQGGQFAKARQKEQQQEMASMVTAELQQKTKRDIAYDNVADRLKVSRSTVRRAVATQKQPHKDSITKQLVRSKKAGSKSTNSGNDDTKG